MEDVMGIEWHGHKQAADLLGYSVRHTKRLLKEFRHLLGHWLGPGHRVRGTRREISQIKDEIRKKKIQNMAPDGTS